MRQHFSALAGTAITVVSGILLYAFMPVEGPGSRLSVVAGVAAVLVIVPLTARRVQAIRLSHRPILDALQALTLLVVLLVFGFASVYLGLARHEGQFVDMHGKIDAVYFTVATLTTVGFGDVHAVGRAARLLVTLQMVADVTLIAVGFKLVSNAAHSRAAEMGVTPQA